MWCFLLGYVKLTTKFEKNWNNKNREQVLLNLTTIKPFQVRH